MIRLTIHGSGTGRTLLIPKGTRLLDALRENGYEITAPCGGNGTCGKCRVLVKDNGYVTSCIHYLQEDLEVILPDKLESAILSTQYRYSKILPLDPGEAEKLSPYPFGVAIDIGTTSIVLYLVQLITGSIVETSAWMNPQGKYGADVISRINYCILNDTGTATLQQEVTGTVNRQLMKLLERQGIDESYIVRYTITGNTTMLHLLLGVNPRPLAFVPFEPVFTGEQLRKASEIGLRAHPEADVRILPSFAAYIGADIVAGLASLALPPEHRNVLFVDIGTNGEMALITPGGIFCCATAAGPAFEGANITHGMGALTGAIKSFTPDEGYRTVGEAPPAGICGSGLIDLVAWMVQSGDVNADGHMETDFVVAVAEHTANNEPVVITPGDIREVQLAKSAIMAGMITLIREAGLDWGEVDALYLAGGFGNYIRVSSAVAIGLLPAMMKGKTIPVGNTSGTGAVLALQSEKFFGELTATTERMKYVELSDNDHFVLEFAMNMNLEPR